MDAEVYDGRNCCGGKRRRTSPLELCLIITVLLVTGLLIAALLFIGLGYNAAGIDLCKGITCAKDSTCEIYRPSYTKVAAYKCVCKDGYTSTDPSRAACTPILEKKVLRSEWAVAEASRIMSTMNVSVDPCEDFWRFSCGSFLTNAKIPDDKSSTTIMGTLDAKLTEQLKALLISPISEADLDAEKKAKNFYKSCMDETLIDELDSEPLLNLLNGWGGWPILGNWNDDGTEYYRKMADSYDGLGSLSVFVDLGGSGKTTLYVSGAGNSYRDELLGEDERSQQIAAAYRTMATKIALMMANVTQSSNPSEASRIETEMNEIIDFEKRIAAITLDRKESSNTTIWYNPMTVQDLINDYPQEWPWLTYINLITGANLTTDSKVVLSSKQYYLDLPAIMRDTSRRLLINHLMWQTVKGVMSFLPSRYTDLQNPISVLLRGSAAKSERWKTCVSATNSQFDGVVGSMYSKEYFPVDAKQDVLVMIEGLKAAFKEIIKGVPWMDANTKRLAQQKLQAIKQAIGFPDYMMNDEWVNLKYAEIQINVTTYFDNNLAIMINSTRYSFSQYNQAPGDEWIYPPSVVNAYYQPTKNKITFMAAILQKFFYNKDYPRYLNYGGIGSVIGHELTHGFDTSGAKYNKDGALVKWWPDEVLVEFEKKAQCMKDQYSKFVVPGIGINGTDINVDGDMTIGENIADNGGMKESYMAYRSWEARRGSPEPTLPGFEEYTNDQMFFLQWGQIWCTKTRDASLVNQIKTGVHSPGQFRVLGPMMNSEEFNRAYNCKVGQYMNPQDKCKVW